MVYVIAELRNYRQLARLRAGSLPEVEAGLAAVLGPQTAPVAAAGQRAWMAELGAEQDLDVGGAAASAWRTREFLSSRREELFGFAVLVASFPVMGELERTSRIKELLEEADADEQLWLSSECALLFADSLALVKAGALYRATGHVRPRPPHARLPQAPRPWIRESLVGRALDIISPRLNTGESREILMAHGPPGVGKTALLGELASRLLRGSGEPPILRMRTLFKRRSPLHPFLGSLLPSLLALVPRYLRGPESEVWGEVGRLLVWLQATEGRERAGESSPLPDHILEDFSLGFRLYLLAWMRIAEEKFLPAVLVCDGIESYHPAARTIMARMFEDFLLRPGFLPLLSSTEAKPPEELAALDVRPLYVHPLGKRDIRSLARHLFPGLEIPESVARRMRSRSGGLYVSVVSYLQYLWKTGRIRTNADHNEWIQAAEGETPLPANPLSVSWYLIRTQHDDTFQLLFALYLAGGLLDRQGFLSFLAEAGFEVAAAEKSLAGLHVAGLLAEEATLIPRFPALRRKLEELLGAEGVRLRDRFIAHMVSLWTAGKYRHPVLLFTFLAKNGRTDLALGILPEIIRRKLDENDAVGARTFCDPRALDFAVPPTPEQGRELAALTAIGRLRAALLEEDVEGADVAQAEAQKSMVPGTRRTIVGEAHIERAKFFLSTGNAVAALDELKKGLLLYQETREEPPDPQPAERGERACYLWLGAAMLADGRLGEAVEYLGLSQRLCHEASDAPGALWTAVYLADCLFVDGRYTQCLAAIEQGLLIARETYRREVELFLLFLKARTTFQVGSYDECSLCLQACLCLATLYSAEAAVPVLRAWLGRALVHSGDLGSGTRLLESLSQSREVLLYLAEGSLFSQGLENASLYVERALALPSLIRFPAPEGVPWQDGCIAIEGRCFRLSRGDAILRRTLTGLRAYLLGLRGFREEGIGELHQLTRGEKSLEVDPSVYWFNYLYSRVLPEAGSEETDDKVTVLSKSLKSLQERASRIDAPAERSSFLWHNRWNRMIMEEARERKLV
jgi:tetratricopeptide (TPR) repeat protein